MNSSLKDRIYLQREALARILRDPLEQLATFCAPVWENRETLDATLAAHFHGIPFCSFLYCVGTDGIQVSNNIGKHGIIPGQLGHDRSRQPYTNETIPDWGFLLSDAYINESGHRPSLTALEVVQRDRQILGHLVANFDLRNLPATPELYEEPGYWRQVKGDPAIRSNVFQQCRVDSPMDENIGQSLAILEELLTERGVFQCQIHFSSSQATIWTVEDAFRYRILDYDALSDPDVCLVYPPRPYPDGAMIPQEDIARVLGTMRSLRLSDPTFYLRLASINIFNGLVSVTFSCDGSHYMPHDEFLQKGVSFWF